MSETLGLSILQVWTLSAGMMLLLQSLYQPGQVFRSLADPETPAVAKIQRFPLLLLLLPPLFAYLGSGWFGWRLGAEEPLFFDPTARIVISFGYFVLIGFGFLSTVVISVWMASTYGARRTVPLHVALLTVVSAPLAVASVVHLYPDVFINVLVLIPAIAWSMVLLYRGLPIVLGIPPERGMLMSSALVAWLLVAAVSLLGISAALWTYGIGSDMWI